MRTGRREAVILLLSRGVDVDPIINDRGATPLHLAAGMGHDQAVKALLEHGADVSCYSNVSFLHWASVNWIYIGIHEVFDCIYIEQFPITAEYLMPTVFE